MGQNANWIGFTVPLPGAPILKPVIAILETLLIFLEICKAILEVIKIFLLLLANPLILLLEALILLIQDLFNILKQSGLYAYYDIPDPGKDPNFKNQRGGFQAFKTRWKGSLLDQKDANRPQPIAGLVTGGFFLFVIDADGIETIIQLVKAILAFFKPPGRPPAAYPPPLHVKAVPLTSSGDPILNIASLFSAQSNSMAIEWQLPGNVRTGSNQFAGAISQVVSAFKVPSWLIEFAVAGKGNTATPNGPPNIPINVTPDAGGFFNASPLTQPLTTGRVMQNTTTQFTDPRNLGSTLPGYAPVLDDNGDPVLKMSYYAIVDGFSAFLQAQLGTVRFVFDNVPLDTDFYVRVRGFFGTLATNDYSVNGNDFVMVNWQSPMKQDMGTGSRVYYLPWPSAGVTAISMGKPSKMIHAKLTTIPDFDLLGDIKALYLAAFALNFHLSPPAAIPEVNASGLPLLNSRGNPVYYPQFDSAGNPIPPLTNANIGQGSATQSAGAIAGTSFPVNNLFYSTYAEWQPDPVTGAFPAMPWQNPQAIFQATKLSVKLGAMFMEAGTSLVASFKTVMRGPLPSGAVDVSFPQGLPTTLENLVKYMTATQPFSPTVVLGQSPQVTSALAASNINNTSVEFGNVQAYAKAFQDKSVRFNVLAGINFLNALNRQGIPPNWISLSLLDIIPWAGQILYDLIAKIQALIDAFKGLFAEIINFINMLERKITAMEQFIEYLISILNFLLSLEVGIYVLPVPSISGDVTSWLSTIDQAGGNVPQSGPTGFTAGVCLAFLGPGAAAIGEAFALLF